MVAVLAAAFAALAGLVAAGVLTGVDQYAVDHLMPGVEASRGSGISLTGLVPFLNVVDAGSSPWPAVADVLTLPASPFVTLALGLWLLWLLWGRGRRQEAAAWLAALAASLAIELVGKGLIERPTLTVHGAPMVPFDASYPSGHTLRLVVVAGLAGALWAVLRPWLALWVAAGSASLVPAGFHTPSDVAGALLVGAAIVLAAGAAGARRPARTRGSPAGVASLDE